MPTKEPASHVTSGPVVTATLSVAVRVDDPVPPESTVNVAGLKDSRGDSLSGRKITLSVAVPSLPAASVAVAVHEVDILGKPGRTERLKSSADAV